MNMFTKNVAVRPKYNKFQKIPLVKSQIQNMKFAN